MKQLLLVAMLVACGSDPRPDERITAEYHQLWQSHGPSLPRVACPDVEAKRGRLQALTALVVDAGKVWPRYEEPLPAPFAERLVALDPGPSVAHDLRCILDDPSTRPSTWTSVDMFAAILLRKGELAVAAGQDAGWHWVAESLRLYSDGPWQAYIHLFQPAWLLERAAQLARVHAPSRAARTELIAATNDAVMTRETLCTGFHDELLAHGGNAFYGHVTDLRGAFLEHWGPELAVLYTEDFAKRSLPSYETWQAFRALIDAMARCTSTPPATLRKELEPLIANLKRLDRRTGMILEVAASRFDGYERMRSAEAAFVALLLANGN